MRGEFDEEPGPLKRGRDTELTLSFTALLAIFFGMVLLCGLFFGLGFAVGRYGPSDSASGPQSSAGAATSNAGNSRPKPSAVSSAVQEPRETVVASASATAAAAAPAVPKPVEPAASPRPAAQTQVKPALPVQNSSSQLSPPVRTAPTISPSTQTPSPPALRQSAPSSGIMVQIAAVSHEEDADVLVNALRRRGYPVSVRRQPADNLLHVQIGPFATRNDANAMRQKLLSDGYNAIVQP